MKRRLCILFWVALLFSCCMVCTALAEWTVFSPDAVPQELWESAMQVSEESQEITLSFLGDCTLGCEKRFRSSARGFWKTAEKKGYEWFFSDVLPLTAEDDVTLVNLEGVLSDRELKAAEKEYCFQGPTAYTEILKLGSVECVTLANNHSMDYGEAGYQDTVSALEAALIAYVSEDMLAVCDVNGVRIGFTASAFRLGNSGKEKLRRNTELLRELGCGILVHSMHCGLEYSESPNPAQLETAAFASELGIDLVIGHHPHVVQGLRQMGETTVLFSLGNAVFGGNSAPEDMDALLVQAVFSCRYGEAEKMTLKLYPISVSSEKRYNDYRLTLLDGEDAQRVFAKMKASTGVDAAVFAGEQP